VAVASANARIEGFIANGELLAGAVAAAGVAAACGYMFRGYRLRWLFVSGVLAGCAMSLKQSGFDGFGAVLVCLVVGGLSRERRWREVLRECVVCVGGWAVVIAVLLLHGIILGFSSWWYALAGYRIGGLNASNADWGRFGITSRLAAPTILPLAAAAIAGVVGWLPFHPRITRKTVLVPAWMCFAIAGFLSGGLFHRHYWVTLTFPLAAAAGVALGRMGSRWMVTAAIVIVVALPSLISTAQVIVKDRAAAALLASDDPRSLTNERIGDWYKQHRTPGSTIYAMCASAALYARTGTIPPFPYLWADGVLNGRGSQDRLVGLFAGDHPPTYVVEYQNQQSCNPDGRVGVLLRQRYDKLDTVDGLTILALRTGAAAAAPSLNSLSR
ncbi:MAG: hypothetical protein QOE00_2740, partial [Ilumatobacteraceae bacterium]